MSHLDQAIGYLSHVERVFFMLEEILCVVMRHSEGILEIFISGSNSFCGQGVRHIYISRNDFISKPGRKCDHVYGQWSS